MMILYYEVGGNPTILHAMTTAMLIQMQDDLEGDVDEGDSSGSCISYSS
jgi:hypothetical protein